MGCSTKFSGVHWRRMNWVISKVQWLSCSRLNLEGITLVPFFFVRVNFFSRIVCVSFWRSFLRGPFRTVCSPRMVRKKFLQRFTLLFPGITAHHVLPTSYITDNVRQFFFFFMTKLLWTRSCNIYSNGSNCKLWHNRSYITSIEWMNFFIAFKNIL